MSASVGSIYAELGLKVEGFEQGVQKAQQGLDKIEQSSRKAGQGSEASFEKVGGSLQKTGKKIGDFGSTLTKGVTLPVMGAGVASVKWGMEFESTSAKVSTIADTTQVSMEDLKASVISMSNETGQSTSSLNEALYQTISAGIQTGDAMKFLETSSKLATGGFTSTEKATDLLSTAVNAYGLEASEATRLSDLFIQTQNLGKTSVDELASSMGKVIPTAKNAGVNIEQLSAGYVELTKNGISTAESTTYMNSMLNEASKGGTQLDKAIREMSGKSFPELMKEGKTLGDVFGGLDEHAKKNGKSLADYCGSAEAAKAAMLLANNGGKDFNKTLEQLGQSTGSTQKAFDKMSETTEFKFKKAMNQAKNSMMELGVKALPAITKVAEGIGKLVDKFNNLNPKTQEMIVKAALLAAGLGPVISAIGKTTSTIGTLVKGAGKAGKALGLFGKASSLAGSTTGVLGGIVGKTGGALAEVAITSAGTGGKIAGFGKAAAIAGGSKGVGVLASGLGGLLPIAGGVVLGLGVMGGALVLASKAWEKTANSTKATVTPTFQSVVDGLEGVSDETKTIVKDIEDQVSSLEAKKITISLDGEVTKQEAKEMGIVIQGFADETTAHIEAKLQRLRKGLGSLYDELPPELKKAYDKSYKNTEEYLSKEKQETQKHSDAVSNIYKKAAEEKRDLTQEEHMEVSKHIEAISQKQAEARIKDMSEYKALKAAEAELRNSHDLETAQKVVENGKVIRDEKAKTAQEIYEAQVAHIEEMQWTNEQDKQSAINKAREKRDGVIQAADEEWMGRVNAAIANSPELIEKYDFVNGKVLSDAEATARKQEILDAQQWASKCGNADKGYSNLNLMSSDSKNINEKNLMECARAWDSYSGDVNDQMAKIKKDYDEGKISNATYQAEINRLTANKKFADQMSSDLKQILADFLSGKIGAAELQEKIRALQSKTITVTTEFKTIGAAPAGGGGPQMGGYNQGTFSLSPSGNTSSSQSIAALVHDSKGGSYGEVMDLPRGTRIYPHDVSMRLARETGKQVAEAIISKLHFNDDSRKEIIVPINLNGKEIARVTAPYISNEFANNLKGRR